MLAEGAALIPCFEHEEGPWRDPRNTRPDYGYISREMKDAETEFLMPHVSTVVHDKNTFRTWINSAATRKKSHDV
jgi:hypothetical protein